MSVTRRVLALVASLGLLPAAVIVRDVRAADVPAEHVSLGVAVQDAAGCPGALSQGACVIGLRPNSAATRAGLDVGDVIQTLGQTPVADAAALVAAMRSLTVGQTVEITYRRAGKVQRSSLQFIPSDRAADLSAGPPVQAPIQTLIVHRDPCDGTGSPDAELLSTPPYRKQRLAVDREALEKRLGTESAFIALQEDVLTLAFRAPGGSASATSGSIQCALGRVGDTDIWALQLQMAQWEQTFLSETFMAVGGQQSDQYMFGAKPTGTASSTYRGSKAPPPPDAVDHIRGKLSTTAVPSKSLGESRTVSVYLPPGGAPIKLPVLYMTDGENLPVFAPIIEALIQAGHIRPIAIVAEHAGRYTGDASKPYDVRLDNRSREYLAVVDPPRFSSHMQFFVKELLPWAEMQYGLSSARADRAAMGFSNGGAFVGQLGIQHPEAFATVLPFSPAAQISMQGELRSDPSRLPRFLFSGGELEPAFLGSARSDAAWLAARGVSTQLRTWWSGHDILQWQQALADYLPQVFPPDSK